jgi:hypothetical protein
VAISFAQPLRQLGDVRCNPMAVVKVSQRNFGYELAIRLMVARPSGTHSFDSQGFEVFIRPCGVLVKVLNNHASGLLTGRTVRSASANGPAQIRKTNNYSQTGTVHKSIAFVTVTCGYMAAEREPVVCRARILFRDCQAAHGH